MNSLEKRIEFLEKQNEQLQKDAELLVKNALRLHTLIDSLIKNNLVYSVKTLENIDKLKGSFD